jgi:hypothetical protein
MKVVVDTCIWSEALRKKSGHPSKTILADLVLKGNAILVGAVRQELLCGFRDNSRFLAVRELLRKYEDPAMRTEDFETAASMSNACRSNGIQGSQTDFLICAVSVRLNAEILTLDHDFNRFSKYLPIRLSKV